MDNKLAEKVRYNVLYDLYGALLTEKQREYFEYYYAEDYSLAEIAELLGVSRNAVFDQLHIVTGYLDDYEEKLKLSQQKMIRANLVKQIKMRYPDDATLQSLVEKIEKSE